MAKGTTATAGRPVKACCPDQLHEPRIVTMIEANTETFMCVRHAIDLPFDFPCPTKWSMPRDNVVTATFATSHFPLPY